MEENDEFIFQLNTKVCTVCEIRKSSDKFYDGKRKCKECISKLRKESNKKISEKINSCGSNNIDKKYVNTEDIDEEEHKRITEYLIYLKENINSVPKLKDVTTLLFFIDSLTEIRFTDLSAWINIGKCIYNYCNYNTEGLSIWLNYGEKYNIFNLNIITKQQCIDLYKIFEHLPTITIRTIIYYVKIDSPKFYDNFYRHYFGTVGSSYLIEMNESNIATEIYKCYSTDYYYCRTENKLYYFDYNTHILNLDTAKTHLQENIQNVYRYYIKKFQQAYEKDIKTKNDINENFAKMYENIYKKLSTCSSLNNIIKLILPKFYYENLNKILDKNMNILAIKNEVIEIVPMLNKIIIRKAIPEDFITKYIKIKYNKDLSYNHPHVIKLLKYFDQLFPNKYLKNYIIKFCCACMIGKNVLKKFFILSGNTHGGKSMFIKLLKLTFGDYLQNVLRSILNKSLSTNSNGPNPELLPLIGAHIAVVSEVDSSAVLDTDKIKSLSGGDFFFARGCCKDGGENVLTPYFLMICNKIPTLSSIDDAISDRIQIIPFVAKYLPNVEDDPDNNIYKRDPSFEEYKLPYLAEALLWLIVDTYPKYI